MNSYTPLVFIVGPTCTGKSAFAYQLSDQHGFSVVNCDSVQIYKHIDIGSAKPSKQEMNQYKHYLYDFVDFPEEFTAGQYREKALSLIDSSAEPLIFVGGSGFYIMALENGMYEVEEVSKEIVDQLQVIIQTEGALGLYKRIEQQDPEFAKTISEQDSYRCKRALGLMMQLNMTMTMIKKQFSQQTEKLKLKNPIVKIGLDMDREVLRDLVRKRVESMLEQGLVDEVKRHIENGFINWAPLLSVGYKEVVESINHQWGRAQLEDEIVKNTMRLAKKQRTWFKRDKNIKWFDALEVKNNSQLPMNYVNDFLKSLEN